MWENFSEVAMDVGNVSQVLKSIYFMLSSTSVRFTSVMLVRF